MIKLEDYYQSICLKFKEYHYNVISNITEDDVHKLRTIIKKLRTFNSLLDGILFRQKDFPLELKKLFKEIGEIRDIQIRLNIMEHDCPYKTQLKYHLKHLISNLKINDNFDSELNYIKNKLEIVKSYHIDEQIINNIRFHISMLKSDVISMYDNVSVNNIHDIRKKVKRIYYIKNMLGDTDVEDLYNIQDSIGVWHDCDVIINNIRSLNFREFDKCDSDLIKELLLN